VSDTPATIYLEADDEVTSVIRRLRAADPGPVVIVAPGRSRATSSVVALRLLGRAAESDGRSIAVVGDALTRSLAAEAGLSAFNTLEEARSADGGPAPAIEPRHAAISVVRGPAADETAPTLAALAPSGTSSDDLTRPVELPPRAPRPGAPRRRPSPTQSGRRRRVPVGLVAALALLLVAATVAGATLLPAATVTIVPRSDEIGPVSYDIELVDAERSSGTVEASAEVVATGTYAVQEPASGTVVLFNWTFFPVEVPAGTFVAAGEQAFATQADVTVPRGQLTGAGTIAAGDIAVNVVAAAPGPAANVPAEAIDVVVDQGIDAQLRGFPENPQRRVVNPEATTGGVDRSGTEIVQEDLDTARASLEQALSRRVEEAVGPEDPDVIAVTIPSGEARIEVPEELVGTRDEERVEISGKLDWEVVRADRDVVTDLARAQLEADTALVPNGHELLAGSVEVEVGEASLADGELVVPVEVVARTISRIDPEEVRTRIAGRSAAEAEASLAEIGDASVSLWPGWVSSVPELDWRVEILIQERTGDGS
jgi:hypothetical protein